MNEMARAVQHQAALLLGSLGWHEPHVGPGDCLANDRESLSVLLKEVLAGQAMAIHSHETFGEYRARLIAGELASAKAREAALRAEVARLKLESESGGQPPLLSSYYHRGGEVRKRAKAQWFDLVGFRFDQSR
jgi:hypothetical protein